MDGRNRFPPRYYEDLRSVPLHRPPVPLPPLEEELDLQQREIQRLLSENRRVISDNVMLDSELNGVKEEIMRLNQVMGKIQVDREVYTRELMERAMKLEADRRSYESLRLEIKQLRGEMQKVMSQKQELSSKVSTVNKDIIQRKTKNQQIPAMRGEIDKMQRDLIDARRNYEYEKKGNEDIVEQNRAMESNIMSMAREIELLRAELATSERSSRGVGGYVTVNESPEAMYQGPYTDVYGLGSRPVIDQRGPPRR